MKPKITLKKYKIFVYKYKSYHLALKIMVLAINIETECCLYPENRKISIILLGTMVISSNFLLEFY